MPTKKKVLVVDGNEINRALLRNILSEEYSVLEATDGCQAFEMLKIQTNELACVLLDLVMPGMDGYELLQKAQQIPDCRNIPIIVTTDHNNAEHEIRALELGAWDFVTKPYTPTILKFRIKNAIDRSQLALLKEMRYMATYDKLTGIYNRVSFFAATRELLDAHPDEAFTFIRFDLENFKLVNSFFGQKKGDDLLRMVGQGIKKCVAGFPYGTYGHITADIFCLCIPHMDKSELFKAIKKAREALHSYQPEFEIVPCFGIYEIEDPSQDVAIMYDHAIVAAKKCKGNYIKNYQFYENEMGSDIAREQLIINSMNSALENKQFSVYYQPKYDVKTNLPVGAEALVRWIHPERGMISPGEFIPVFERNGFISKLDYYVWDEVCQTLARFKKEGRPETPISVNVSRVNLYNPNLTQIFIKLIQQYDIPARLLNLEITETAYTQNTHLLQQTVAGLQKEGFVIMMDDFGSGYSCLNMLKEIPVDVLKVDMKFLPRQYDGRAERILASVIRMAKGLGMPVIVEGVENEEQTALLSSLGCDYIQGYYFARPMPLKEYEHLLDEQQGAETKITQEESRHSRDLMDELLRTVPENKLFFKSVLHPMALFEYKNETLEVLRVNKAYLRLIGEKGDMLDSTEAGDETAKKSVTAVCEQVCQTKETAECEYAWLRANGVPLWLHLKMQYVNCVGGRNILLGMFTDISEQKLLKIKLLSYQRQLQMLNPEQGDYLLVVDDLPMNRAILCETFRSQYKILEAENGRQGLAMLRRYKKQIVAVLLDMIMPEMDGSQVLREKNADPEIASIPVVVISADSKRNVQLDALEQGVYDYITKPFVAEVVSRRVNNAIEYARSQSIFQRLLRNEKEKRCAEE